MQRPGFLILGYFNACTPEQEQKYKALAEEPAESLEKNVERVLELSLDVYVLAARRAEWPAVEIVVEDEDEGWKLFDETVPVKTVPV
jgi:hypothetical protein